MVKKNKKLAFLIILLLFFFHISCKKKSKYYNVLIITIDTLRADRVSLYNDSFVKTPAIDSVGKDGIIFKYAFANVPVTLPSHTGIMTGLYPPSHGVRDNSGYIVSPDNLTIAEYLKRFGYDTGAFIGAFPLDSRFGLNQGFDVYDDNYGAKNSNDIFFVERKAEKVVNLSINWLKKRKNKWFVWIHLFDPHQPYDPPEPFKTKFKSDLYSGEVAYVDSQLERLFDYLKKSGLYDKTIIIITADHGEGLGEHGEKTHAYFAYNTTIHIPLIIKYPQEKTKGKIISDFVTHVDIFPTLCDILGIKIPGRIEGVSLFDLMEGKRKKLKNRLIYFESLPPFLNRGWAPLTGIIDTEAKKKFIDQPIPELYDLNKDFDEKDNLAEKSEIENFKRKLKTLKDKLENNKIRGEEGKKINRAELKKLQSLGYLGSSVKYKKRTFAKKDDLKVLLPLQNKMLEGLGLFSQGDYERSLKILSDVVKERKDFVLVWNKIAEIFKRIGKPELALVTYEKALAYNKDNYNLLLNFGAFLSQYDFYDRAIKILNRAKKIIEYDPDLWNALGVSYWKSGEIEKAIDCFNRSLELDNNNAIVYSNLGGMYFSILLYDKAEENLKKALSLDPELVSALNTYAALLKKRGETEKALKYWEKIITIDKNYFMAYYNLVAVYLDRREYSKAMYYYKLAEKNKVIERLSGAQKRDFLKLYRDLRISSGE